MNRSTVFALALLLPTLAAAQAIRCTDPATGKVLYTDQPCKGGTLVVPKRTEAEQRADEEAAALAQDRAERRAQQAQEQALQREQLRQQTLAAEAARAAAASPADSAACRRAQQEASFRAASFSATEEEIRTARYNAALACGQQPPAEIVVVQPVQRAWPLRPPPPVRPPQRFGVSVGSALPPQPAAAVKPARPANQPPVGAVQVRPARQPGFTIGADPQDAAPAR